MKHIAIGKTGLSVPELIVGTSALGNLYGELTPAQKRELVNAWYSEIRAPLCIDSAGKYGAGLALEELGRFLGERFTDRQDIVLSNKLGWKRVPLTGTEPTFEPGVWKNLAYDAVQTVSYDGIIACFEQGNALLGERYNARMVSVHDPDEYLSELGSDSESHERTDSTANGARGRKWEDILDAYQALSDLKRAGAVDAVGVGAKNWRVIRELADRVSLDWVMFANSFTIYRNDRELSGFMRELAADGVCVINSALFQSGFLVGGSYFDYRPVREATDRELFEWRERFFAVCRKYEVSAADACIEYGLSPAAVQAVALNTTSPGRVQKNVRAIDSRAPEEFWTELREEGLISMTPEELR